MYDIVVNIINKVGPSWMLMGTVIVYSLAGRG